MARKGCSSGGDGDQGGGKAEPATAGKRSRASVASRGSAEEGDVVGEELISKKYRRSKEENLSGYEKPNVPFSVLIKEVILNSPCKRLLLHEIYDAIASAHPFFKSAGEGWKNSVRHNLSINSMFCKVPREIIADIGQVTEEAVEKAAASTKKKGCYWLVRDVTQLPGAQPIQACRRKSLNSLRYRTLWGSQRQHKRATLTETSAITGKVRVCPTTDSVRIGPYVANSKILDIGRRYSDSHTDTVQPVSIQELKKDLARFEAGQQMIRPLRSIYGTGSEAGDLFDLQPLPFEDEGNFMREDEDWWVPTGPLGGSESTGRRSTIRTSRDDSLIDYSYIFMDEKESPRKDEEHLSDVGENTATRHAFKAPRYNLPHRNPIDIWLADAQNSPKPDPRVNKQ